MIYPILLTPLTLPLSFDKKHVALMNERLGKPIQFSIRLVQKKYKKQGGWV